MRAKAFLFLLAVLGPGGARAFKIGVGGQYPLGYEGLIARMGLCRERILDSELCDPDALARYDAVVVCGPGQEMKGFPGAFGGYVEGGGDGLVGLWRWTPDDFFPAPMTRAGSGLDLVVVNEEHPVARGYRQGDAIQFYDHEEYTLSVSPAPHIQIPVRYAPKEPEGSLSQPALIVFPFWGEGRLVYAAAPLGFSLFWRGLNAERLAANCVRYLVDGRASELFLLDRNKDAWPPESSPVEPGDWEVRDAPAYCPQDAVELARVTGPYNLLLVVGREVGAPPHGSVSFDSLPWCSWEVERRGQSVVLKRVQRGQARIVRHARLRWAGGEGRGELLVERRRHGVRLFWNRVLLFGARTPPSEGGAVCLSPGSAWDEETVRYQPVSPAFMADDFMRDSGELGAWDPVFGLWRTVSLEHPETATNGFFLRGAVEEGEDEAVCLAGYWFWERYAASVSVSCEEGCGEAGLLFLARDEKEHLAFLLRPGAPGGYRICRVRGPQSDVLAEGTMEVLPSAWYRLGMRTEAGRILAAVDGRRVADIPRGASPCGGIGLRVAGGGARFDDLLVEPSGAEAFRLPGGEGTSWPRLPGSAAAADFCTWADRAVEWRVSAERRGFAWHKGRFWGDLLLSCPLPHAKPEEAFRRGVHLGEISGEQGVSIVLRHEARSPRATVSLSDGAGKELSRALALASVASCEGLRVQRRGRTVSCGLMGGEDLLEMIVPGKLTRLGLSVEGPPLDPNRLRFESGHVKDYCFAVAPTDWKPSSGTWAVAPRWSCDPRWSWLSGWSEETAAIWHKESFQGDLVFDVYMGIKMKAPGGDERGRCRDLNLSLFGDGKDPLSGYAFVFGGHGGVVTSLWRKGECVVQNPSVWVPREYAMHHQWFHVQMERSGDQVVCRFEGREILRYADPEPLSEGRVGLWTRNSGISVPRATIYFQRRKTQGGGPS